jgi:hypothetical protein
MNKITRMGIDLAKNVFQLHELAVQVRVYSSVACRAANG